MRAAIAENVFTLISSQMSNDDFATLFECVNGVYSCIVLCVRCSVLVRDSIAAIY